MISPQLINELGIFDIKISTAINACVNKDYIKLEFKQVIRNYDGKKYHGIMHHDIEISDLSKIDYTIYERAKKYSLE